MEFNQVAWLKLIRAYFISSIWAPLFPPFFDPSPHPSLTQWFFNSTAPLFLVGHPTKKYLPHHLLCGDFFILRPSLAF